MLIWWTIPSGGRYKASPMETAFSNVGGSLEVGGMISSTSCPVGRSDEG